jgi:chromosome segregation ATPase
MYTSRAYNENYFISRKKILEDFIKDEENDTMKYIDDIEQLVSSTKLALKGLVSGEFDHNQMKEKLLDIENELSQECVFLEQDLSALNTTDKNIEQNTLELQRQEEKGTFHYLEKIEELKKDLEIKEFKIQNMERLYVELENIIKENIRLNNEQLLTLEQFSEFVSQNDRLKEECELLEEEKRQCIQDYNNLLRENVNLRSKDESFEIEKIKDALEEISAMGNLHKEAELKINKLQEKFKDLNKECNNLTSQIKMITKNLESLNIDNIRLNKELTLINKELFPCHKRLNKSFSESTNFEENSIFAYSNTEACEQTLKQLKKRKHTNSTLV